MKNEYKIKLFLDKDKKPIIPFTTLDTVFKTGSDQTLAELLANIDTKQESDSKNQDILASAKTYAQEQDANILQESKGYTDAKPTIILVDTKDKVASKENIIKWGKEVSVWYNNELGNKYELREGFLVILPVTIEGTTKKVGILGKVTQITPGLIQVQGNLVIENYTGLYSDLTNKPSINGIELIGDKTGADLNLVGAKYRVGNYFRGEVFNNYSLNRAECNLSHVEGTENKAYGNNGDGSHVEGKANECYASEAGHVEGFNNVLSGATHAHVGGRGNYTSVDISSLVGKYGRLEGVNYRDTLFAVGNGTSASDTNIGMHFLGNKGNGKLYVEHKKVITENNEGTVGQFLVSDGAGGANWTTVPTAEGGSF